MNQAESFEGKLKRLQEITEILERDSANLEETVALFEEASRLAKECSALLDRAELKVQTIMKGEDGLPVEVPADQFNE